MPGLDHAVIRMKVEKLRLEVQQGPGNDASVEQQIYWLRDKFLRLVEILLYLGK
jgi:hypothetical protein